MILFTRSKKAQSAMELMIVIGISMSVLMASSLMLLEYSKFSTNQIMASRIDEIGNGMVGTAQIIGNYGEPARMQVEYNMPPNIDNMTIIDSHVLFFEVSMYGRKAYFGYYSEKNITANFPGNDYSEGKKTFMIKAVNKTVNISRWRK